MTKHQFCALLGLIFAVLSVFISAYPLLAIAVICLAIGLYTFNI